MRLPSDLPPAYSPLQEREVLVQGRKVVYTEAGSGPPVLMLHGAVFGGNVFWWENQAALADRYRTIAPDFPGWGASDKPAAAYTMHFYHEFITAFLDALGLDKVAIVGHSMGGLLGSSYALRYPERVTHLVTIAVPPAWVDMGIPLLFRPFTFPIVGELTLNALPVLGPDFPLGVRTFYEGLFHAPKEVAPERMRRALAGCVEAVADPAHRAAFLSTLRDNKAMFMPGRKSPFEELLPAAGFPVMLIAGREDRLFPLPLVQRGAAKHPPARLEVLDACGNFPQWERSSDVERLIAAFV
jgi:2-hydroxy-6-oxonona-2,4-dienedioate hydrolase